MRRLWMIFPSLFLALYSSNAEAHKTSPPYPHQRIALESLETWPDAPQELLDHVYYDFDLAQGGFACGANYDGDPVWEDIIVGSVEADELKTPLCFSFDEFGWGERVRSQFGFNGPFEHFFKPGSPRGGGYNGNTENDTFNVGLQLFLPFIREPANGHYDSAARTAEHILVDFIIPLYHQGWRKEEAFYWMGHVNHLGAGDVCGVPDHVHNLPHGIDRFQGSVYEEWFDSQEKISPYTGEWAGQKYDVNNLSDLPAYFWQEAYPPSQQPNDLMKLFIYCGLKTQEFPGKVRDQAGAWGHRFYFTYDSVFKELPISLWQSDGIIPFTNPDEMETRTQEAANALMKHALRSGGELYRIMWDAVQQHGIETHYTWLASGWNNIQHPFFVPANMHVAYVNFQGETLSVREAVRRGWISNMAYELVDGAWHTSGVEANEWRLFPWRLYSVYSFHEGVELILVVNQTYPRTTTHFTAPPPL